ncbi:MAG: hypothetical protein RMK97_01980 [Sutterellaceae bacterium]|nr:hypothetical protein [Burkholderiaceae bacterium]MDW8429263.1 hypothetical protein [Sutterellaceae bacterium]
MRQELASAQQHLYEVLGISDIMRGATDPDETLGAQQLKAQFGASRMQFTLNEIAQWIANACTIRAEIICRHWQPDTIIKRSNVLATPDAQLAPQAVQLLKTDEWRWRITVEPDTIASIDYAQERDARTQLLQHLSVLVQNVQPLVQNAPQAVPLVMQLVKWAMASFKVGKEIEGALDQAIEAANAAAQQPPPPPMEIELEKMRHANQLALQQMKSDTERDIQASKAALEVLKLGMENRLQAITQTVQALADNLAQQRDDVRAQLAMQRDLSQIPPQLQTALDALQLSIDELANRKPPKRRRRPIRDENGDIVEVIEEDIPEEEEQAQQPAVPPTPPTVLPPGVM